MNIDNLTIGEAKALSSMFNTASASTSMEIGKAYLIRTVTMIYTGRIVAITDTDIALDNAAWIADTGRFATALQSSELSEIEPYPNGCFINRNAIVDYSPWKHPLPSQQK